MSVRPCIVWMACAILPGIVLPAAASTLYKTGFEPPTFSAGPIVGQDGWTGSNAAVIGSTTVKSGTLAVAFPAGLPDFSFASHPVAFSLSSPDRILKISIDMYLSPSASKSGTWDPLGVSGKSGFLTQLAVDGDAASLGLASSSVGRVPISRGVWNTFELELNHRTLTVTAFVNGTMIGSGPFANGANVADKVTFGLLQGPADAAAYFDNLSIGTASDDGAQFTFTTGAGAVGGPGSIDGSGSEARFSYPFSPAVDGAGIVYVSDTHNHTIRRISPAGAVTTFAGAAGQAGSEDRTGNAARFSSPRGLAIGGDGNIYVADSGNSTIRRIDPAGEVTTIAGSAGQVGTADGSGPAARFRAPYAVTLDAAGNIYVADGNAIRKITPGRIVTTVAGKLEEAGSADGTGSAARFNFPWGVAADRNGNVYIADTNNCTLRMMTPAGVVTTVAGQSRQIGFVDGTGSAARLSFPAGLALDASGAILVAEVGGRVIRRVTPSGVVTTLAGSPTGGLRDGVGSAAQFQGPAGIAADAGGNAFVADTEANTIRKVSSAGLVATIAGKASEQGSSDGTWGAARFSQPAGLAATFFDVYVADAGNGTIRKMLSTGNVVTVAGSPKDFTERDGTGSAAGFFSPYAVAIDASSNLYVADYGGQTIRKVTPAGVTTTIAGLAYKSGSSDGQGSAARFAYPEGIAVGPGGAVYVADTGNHAIRKITPAGEVTTAAGSPAEIGSADGPASAARFNRPAGIAVSGDGTITIADKWDHTIRRISPDGIVTTLAGSAGNPGSTDGSGSAARFNFPQAIALDSEGNVIVADYGNRTLRKVTPAGAVTTLGGSPGAAGSEDGTGAAARFEGPTGVAAIGGRIYVTSANTNTVIRADTASTLADVASIDVPHGPRDSTRLLFPTPDTATTWSWSVVHRPAASVAALSSPSARTPTFTPDKLGLFTFRLVATRGSLRSITTVDLEVRTGDRRRSASH